MSILVKKNNTWTKIAGNCSELVAGATTIREGTATMTVGAGNTSYVDVVFDSPMPDDDYEITFSHTPNHSHLFYMAGTPTKTGFRLLATSTYSVDLTTTVTWKAFKLYTVQDVAELEAKVTELEAKVTEPETAGDWVDVSSTMADVENNTVLTLGSERIAHYRKLGPYLMQVDFCFNVQYLTDVSDNTTRDEPMFTVNIPAVLSKCDTHLNILGYTRSNAGIVNPMLIDKNSNGLLQVSSKVYHAIAMAVNSTQQFCYTGIVAVEKWLD